MVRTRKTVLPVDGDDAQHNEPSDIRQRGHASHRRRRGKAPVVEESPRNQAEEEAQEEWRDMYDEQTGAMDDDDGDLSPPDGHAMQWEAGDQVEDAADDEDDDAEQGGGDAGGNKSLKRLLQVIDRQDKQLTSFPGGPSNLTVLRNYGTHVAGRVWRFYTDGNIPDRPLLRLYNHDHKLRADKTGGNAYLLDVLSRSGLSSLVHCRYTAFDRGLISAFVERWHPETSSFHLPCGEMTITLDDVGSLLHIPVRGAFFTLPVLDNDECVQFLAEQLRMTPTRALDELLENKGKSVRFTWLEKVISMKLTKGDLESAAKAYMLRLLGLTLFSDKTRTKIQVRYLYLVQDLGSIGDWAWGGAALAYMYQCLSSASRRNTLSIAGYTTLLQAWIFEHFPESLFPRKLNEGYTEDMPRAMKWACTKADGSIAQKRANLDDISGDIISWTPYSDHRQAWAFDDISLFSGWLRCSGILHPHQPERVLRQFGYIQSIPPGPMCDTPTCEDADEAWLMYHDFVIRPSHRAMSPAQTAPDYFPWYRIHSHPYMIPPDTRDLATASAAGRFALIQKWLDKAMDPMSTGAPPEGSDVWIAHQNLQCIVSQSLHGDLVYRRTKGRGSGNASGSSARQ